MGYGFCWEGYKAKATKATKAVGVPDTKVLPKAKAHKAAVPGSMDFCWMKPPEEAKQRLAPAPETEAHKCLRVIDQVSRGQVAQPNSLNGAVKSLLWPEKG